MTAETPGLEVLVNPLEIRLMFRREVPCRHETRLADTGTRPEPPVRVGEHVQPLLRRDAREIADAERPLPRRRTRRVPIQVNAERHQAHLLPRDAEVRVHV